MDCIKDYINLTRINKPTGIALLLLPCLFGIALSYKSNPMIEVTQLIKIILLFTLGSVLMRSAGCVINDIFDRNFDRKVKRTKQRPIADNRISVKKALAFLTMLLAISLLILLQFNFETILLGFSIFILVVIYPLTKRITYYPQLFLGITFSIGVLMASTAILEEITLPIFTLYLSAILWTVIYDTIYGYQDIEDDLKIGVKSTAIKFSNNPRLFLYSLVSIQTALLIITGFLANLGIAYYLLIATAFFHLLCQIRDCDFNDGQSCLQKFKSNIFTGLIILLAICLG